MSFRSRQDVPEHLERAHPGSLWVTWQPGGRASRWLVRVDVGRISGRLECIGLEIRSFRESSDGGWPPELPAWDENPQVLQRRTVRDLPLGQILDDLGGEMQQVWVGVASLLEGSTGDPATEDDLLAKQWANEVRASVEAERRRGRRRRGAPELAAIAQVYLDAQDRRQSTTVAVAKWGGVSPSTAAKWIMRVRRELPGVLPPPANAPKKRGKR